MNGSIYLGENLSRATHKTIRGKISVYKNKRMFPTPTKPLF